jgi:hypothetical protein
VTDGARTRDLQSHNDPGRPVVRRLRELTIMRVDGSQVDVLYPNPIGDNKLLIGSELDHYQTLYTLVDIANTNHQILGALLRIEQRLDQLAAASGQAAQ